MQFILNGKTNIYIYIFEYFKLEKMTKMGFEHWLILSDYTLVVSTASLNVTANSDSC